MPNLGFPEIMILLVVALVVFGPKKIPELGKSLGQGIREFRRSTQGLKDEFDGVVGGTLNGSARQTPVPQPVPVRAAAELTPPLPTVLTSEPLQRD